MNSKQRVQAVLKGEIPDKLPWGELAIDFDTVEKILGHETYLRNKAKCQIAFWEGRRDEVVQSWKEDIVELYSKLDCMDIINLNGNAQGLVPAVNAEIESPKRIDETTWESSDGKIYKYSNVTHDIHLINDPEKWTKEFSKENYSKSPVCEKPDESIFEVVDYVIEKLGEEKYILGPSGDEVGMILFNGMERGLLEFVTNPDTIKAAGVYYTKKANQDDYYYVRKGTDAVFWGQDFSYNSGPMISPDMFNEMVFPILKERVNNINKNFGLPVIKHACGNNWKLMDMFVEAGFVCYQGIQKTAGMDIGKLKELYGNKICLWGGVPVEVLVSGTKDELIKEISQCIRVASGDGGFIIGSSHSIAVGTKYDNFMTMIDEIEKRRFCY